MINSFKFNQSIYKFYTNLFFKNVLSIIVSLVFISGCNQIAYNVDPDKPKKTEKPETGETSLSTSALFNHINEDVLRITSDQINNNTAIQWMDVKQFIGVTKFIIPLPKYGGTDLIIPQKDGNGEPMLHAGGPITDWQGKAKNGKGIVFYNHKDKAFQGAVFDGESVIIINQVTQEEAQKIEEKVQNLLADPLQHKDHMGLSEIEQLLKYIADELKITDMYDSDRKYVDAKLKKIVNNKVNFSSWTHFGLYRPLGEKCKACYLVTDRKAKFEGPTLQTFDKDAVIVKDEDGNNIRLVQTEIFLDTYVNQDGEKMTKNSLVKNQFSTNYPC